MEAALKAYEQACALHEKAGDGLGEASALVSLGNVQFKKGALDAALQYYHLALKLHERGGNVMGQARALTNVGSVMGRQGQLTAALDTLHRARGFYLEIEDDCRGLQAVDKLIARFERQIEEKKINLETISAGPLS